MRIVRQEKATLYCLENGITVISHKGELGSWLKSCGKVQVCIEHPKKEKREYLNAERKTIARMLENLR